MRRFDNWEFVNPGHSDWAECYDLVHGGPVPLRDPDFIMFYNYPRYSIVNQGGSGDSVEVYKEGKEFFIYTYSERFGYAGLQIVKIPTGKNPEIVFENFYQNVEDYFYDLNKDFFEYSIPNQIKMLDQRQYI